MTRHACATSPAYPGTHERPGPAAGPPQGPTAGPMCVNNLAAALAVRAPAGEGRVTVVPDAALPVRAAADGRVAVDRAVPGGGHDPALLGGGHREGRAAVLGQV